METKNRTRAEYSHVDSRMNSDYRQKEMYYVVESIIGFDHADFSERIIDQMKFIGLENPEVAKACKIDIVRFRNLLNNKLEYYSHEITAIRKILNLY